MNKNQVCILFSGGSDSSLTAYRMSIEFEKVHLLTYKQFGQINIENSIESFNILNKKFPDKFIHKITDISEMFLKIYNHDYLYNLIKYRTMQIQFTCFACQACFHISTIIYCIKNSISEVRDGANTEYEEASPMQIKIVKEEIKKFCSEYGINHFSPIYDDHEKSRSDYQLFDLGLRPQKNIKDDLEMYKKYQGYCTFMPGSVIFLNYWKRCKQFPDAIHLKMKERWINEKMFFKSIVEDNLS